MSDAKPKRRWRNLLLQPGLQTRLGFYCAAVSGLFAAAVYAILLANYSSITDAILQLTGSNDQVRDVIGFHWNGTQLWLYLSAALYVMAILVLSVWYTHRMVGPTIALGRHIERLEHGDFKHRTHLRRGDAFHELADALNRLSNRMEKENGGEYGGTEGKRAEARRVDARP